MSISAQAPERAHLESEPEPEEPETMPEEEGGGVTPPDPGTLPEEPDVIAPEPESERPVEASSPAMIRTVSTLRLPYALPRSWELGRAARVAVPAVCDTSGRCNERRG